MSCQDWHSYSRQETSSDPSLQSLCPSHRLLEWKIVFGLTRKISLKILRSFPVNSRLRSVTMFCLSLSFEYKNSSIYNSREIGLNRFEEIKTVKYVCEKKSLLVVVIQQIELEN